MSIFRNVSIPRCVMLHPGYVMAAMTVATIQMSRIVQVSIFQWKPPFWPSKPWRTLNSGEMEQLVYESRLACLAIKLEKNPSSVTLSFPLDYLGKGKNDLKCEQPGRTHTHTHTYRSSLTWSALLIPTLSRKNCPLSLPAYILHLLSLYSVFLFS